MKITDIQFNNILNRYLDNKKFDPSTRLKYSLALRDALAFVEDNIAEGLLYLAAIGASDLTAFQEQQEKFNLLCQFLDACLFLNKKNYQFNSDSAWAAKAMLLDPYLHTLDSLRLYDDPSNLAVREKYSRGLLTATHWATDTDLQRMLEITETKKLVRILPFNVPSIGTALHFTRLANKDNTEPYSLLLMLNKGSENNGQGTHWIAAKINVNPLQNSVSYSIEDSFEISEAQKNVYKQLIENAIKFDDGVHKAYSDAQILESQIQGSGSQKDGYSCGYRALHWLFQDPSILQHRSKAISFASENVEDSAQLVRSFYQHQLENLVLPLNALDNLPSSGRTAFNKPNATQSAFVRINEQSLEQFIKFLPETIIPPVSTASVHASVQQVVGQYVPDVLIMRFPATANAKGLDSAQYLALFNSFAQNEQIIENPIPQLVLTHCDNAALDGLNTFLNNPQPQLFKQLSITIDLDEPNDIGEFINKFKYSLSNLSRANLKSVKIEDNKNLLTESHLQDLVEFVHKNTICTAIELPNLYRNSDFQKQLDNLVDVNNREKNSKALGKQSERDKSPNKKHSTKIIRSRNQVDLRKALKVDIELQEGINESVTVAVKPLKARKLDTPYPDIKIYRLTDLKDAVISDNFTHFSQVASKLTKEQFIDFWHQIFGNIAIGTFILGKKEKKGWLAGKYLYLNKNLNGISDRALTQLANFKEYFEDGVNLSYLPQGFLLIADPQNPNNRVLHYDKFLNSLDTIAPKLLTHTARPILSIGLTDKLINLVPANKSCVSLWNRVNQIPYLREENELFRKNLLNIIGLTQPQIEELLLLCGNLENFNYSKLDFIFQNMDKASDLYPYKENTLINVDWLTSVFTTPQERTQYCTLASQISKSLAQVSTNSCLYTVLESRDAKELVEELKLLKLTTAQLNGLLTIYDKYDLEGINKLLSKWKAIDTITNVSLIQFPSIMAYTAGYEAMLHSSEVFAAVNIISSFSPQQRIWWDKLYESHRPINDYLPNLVKSFTDFSKEIAAKGLSFKKIGPFKDSANMPTRLARILTLLNACKADEVPIIWHNITQNDLSPQGAVFAITEGADSDTPCSFVIPEMALNVSNPAANQDQFYNYIPAVKDINLENTSTLRRDFYRYISHQKYRLPLDFYENALRELEQARQEKSLPEDVVNNLYGILANVTTGDNYRIFIKDTESASSQWRSVVENIKKISIIVFSVDRSMEAKTALVWRIIGLTNSNENPNQAFIFSLPALPIFESLISLLATPWHNVGALAVPRLLNTVGPKLLENADKLGFLINKHGSQIYSGLFFYKSEDYRKNYKFYTFEDVNKTHPQELPLLEYHFEICNLLDTGGLGGFLIPLISTFKITPMDLQTTQEIKNNTPEGEPNIPALVKSLTGLKQIINSEQDRSRRNFIEYQLNYAFTLLQQIQNNKNLTPKSLLEFIDSLPNLLEVEYARFLKDCKESTENLEFIDRKKGEPSSDVSVSNKLEQEFADARKIQAVMTYLRGHIESPENNQLSRLQQQKLATYREQPIRDVLEQRFKNNFSENYFNELRGIKPQAQVQLKIDTLFKNQSTKTTALAIQNKFHHANEVDQTNLLYIFATLCEDLSASEQAELFNFLQDKRLLETSIEEYSQLLTTIAQNGVNSFIYFMRSAAPNAKSSENLVNKVYYFLANALPLVRSKTGPLLNELDLTGLVANLVLSGNESEIDQKFNSDSPLLVAYANLKKRIDGGVIEPILTEIQSLRIHSLPDDLNTKLTELEEHLQWVRLDETEDVEQDIITQERKLKSGLLHGLKKFVWGKTIPDTEIVEVKTKQRIQRKILKDIDSNLLKTTSELIATHINYTKSYSYSVSQIISMIDSLVVKYPVAKQPLLTFTANFLNFKDSNGAQIVYSYQALQKIHDEFLALDDQNMIISICEHFNASSDKPEALTYKLFLDIIQGKKVSEVLAFEAYPNLSQSNKNLILKVITSLLNNDKHCSPADIQALIKGCNDSAIYSKVLSALFKCAPYPTIDKVTKWVDLISLTNEVAVATIVGQYNEWTKNPVVPEESIGFHLIEATKQATLIEGVKYSTEELKQINSQVNRVKTLTDKNLILKIITSLLNNDKHCSPADIQALIKGCNDSEIYSKVLTALFKYAPFPTIDEVTQWVDSISLTNEVAVAAIVGEYNVWTKNPVAREESNGFHLAEATKQAALIEGVKYSTKELEQINSQVNRVKTLKTQELLDEIKQINAKDPKVADQLVALMAELLYRTKGLPQKEVGEERVLGRSFEINTTQYLAIHSMLKTGRHVTNEIATGEGKSRIMMISMACQFALGMTVDFVTSDLSLARRDYLEYQSFFKALGAQTNLIYADTPAREYCKGGINFSDAANLRLFRNKAHVEGQEDLVFIADKTKRCLMLDEADKTYFDSADTRYNYSAKADPSISDMPYVYELLVEFFEIPENISLYYADADKCNSMFYSFAAGKLTDAQMARLVYNPKIPKSIVTTNQLEAWQSSALTARELVVNKDFIIQPNVTIQTKEGMRVSSQAYLVGGARSNEHAKFSFGVHQCLHALLNLLAKLKNAQDPILAAELLKADAPFNIDSENQIVYSSTSLSLADDYNEGTLFAVTGSKGSIEEIEEAAELFGLHDGTKMQFLGTPRHRGLRREDLPVSIAKNSLAHYAKILSSIRESLAKNPPQPILLICENDAKSEELFKFLEANLSAEEKQELVRISAKTSMEDEADHVKNKAGKPGAITVSTPMLSRGTDISLHKGFKKAKGENTSELATSGLSVIGTFLPRARDYIQIIGRAGRFGAIGQSRFILNKEEILKQEGITTQLADKNLPSEFYTATEAYLMHLQKGMDLEKQKQRIVKFTVGAFRMQFTKQFFAQFYKSLIDKNNKENLLIAWQVFFDATDKSWNEQWPKITEVISNTPFDAAALEKLFAEYLSSVAEEWKSMCNLLKAQIKSEQIKCNNADFVDQVLDTPFKELKLPDKLKPFMEKTLSAQPSNFATVIADDYDTAYIGRAVLYTHWTDSFRAFFHNITAAWNGDGPWFPNLKAVQQGNLSWSQLFFGTWGSPIKSEVEKPKTDSSIKESVESETKTLPVTKIIESEQADKIPVSNGTQSQSFFNEATINTTTKPQKSHSPPPS